MAEENETDILSKLKLIGHTISKVSWLTFSEVPAKIREKSKKKFAKQNKTNATDKRIWNEYISFVPIDCMSLAFADRLIVDCDDDFVTLFMHKKNCISVRLYTWE